MNEEQLQAVEEEMLAEMDWQTELEEQIEEEAFRTAHDLTKASHRTEIEWRDTVYICTAGHRTAPDKTGRMHEYIVLVVADKTKFRILNGKYIPFTVTAEVDNSLGYEENLRAMVSAWLRHVSGLTDRAEFQE